MEEDWPTYTPKQSSNKIQDVDDRGLIWDLIVNCFGFLSTIIMIIFLIVASVCMQYTIVLVNNNPNVIVTPVGVDNNTYVVLTPCVWPQQNQTSFSVYCNDTKLYCPPNFQCTSADGINYCLEQGTEDSCNVAECKDAIKHLSPPIQLNSTAYIRILMDAPVAASSVFEAAVIIGGLLILVSTIILAIQYFKTFTIKFKKIRENPTLTKVNYLHIFIVCLIGFVCFLLSIIFRLRELPTRNDIDTIADCTADKSDLFDRLDMLAVFLNISVLVFGIYTVILVAHTLFCVFLIVKNIQNKKQYTSLN